eukprot:516798-Rhodomonas_salina.3
MGLNSGETRLGDVATNSLLMPWRASRSSVVLLESDRKPLVSGRFPTWQPQTERDLHALWDEVVERHEVAHVAGRRVGRGDAVEGAEHKLVLPRQAPDLVVQPEPWDRTTLTLQPHSTGQDTEVLDAEAHLAVREGAVHGAHCCRHEGQDVGPHLGDPRHRARHEVLEEAVVNHMHVTQQPCSFLRAPPHTPSFIQPALSLTRSKPLCLCVRRCGRLSCALGPCRQGRVWTCACLPARAVFPFLPSSSPPLATRDAARVVMLLTGRAGHLHSVSLLF